MGKYMRKSKTTGEVALMEASFGVRTRAKTLALQRLQNSTTTAAANSSGGSYLQLRNRRLEKPLIVSARGDTRRQRQPPKESNLLNPRGSRASSRLNKEEGCMQGEKKVVGEKEGCLDGENCGNDEKEQKSNDEGVEASFGENLLEFEGRERSTRETTPCSLIRDPDTIKTPGSSNRPTSSSEANRRVQNSMTRHIPTAHEMNEFFTGAEEEQQKQFVEKYNFDPVNDKPLPGRYKWVKLDP